MRPGSFARRTRFKFLARRALRSLRGLLLGWLLPKAGGNIFLFNTRRWYFLHGDGKEGSRAPSPAARAGLPLPTGGSAPASASDTTPLGLCIVNAGDAAYRLGIGIGIVTWHNLFAGDRIEPIGAHVQ
jgi:hypothetical protein